MTCDGEMSRYTSHDGIAGLGLIGDRRTAALVDRNGEIRWYCPGRFDHPSLFAGLLDSDAGSWQVEVTGARPKERHYLGTSAVLRTILDVDGCEWTITDFMPIMQDGSQGRLCRQFSIAPAEVRMTIRPRPNYSRDRVRLTQDGDTVSINGQWRVFASHPLAVVDEEISLVLPIGDAGWAVLADANSQHPRPAIIDAWLTTTLDAWHRISSNDQYTGPYRDEVLASLRALRMLHHEESGGIVAAITTSLPETLKGVANWDYRYVWLRDAGMIVSALLRAGDGGSEGQRYLDFICSSCGSSSRYPLSVLTTLDRGRAPEESRLNLAGYDCSKPVRIGNGANDQLQLDGFGNVLLAAKIIYERREDRPHWDTIAAIADFLAAHWTEPDHGIWEEAVTRQYTTGKVITSCGLESIAQFSTDPCQAGRWRAAAQAIREFVVTHCLTPTGAYAVFSGSAEVDVSAALYPIWAYTAPEAPEMEITIAELEARHSWRGLLFWRHLECSEAKDEGAFLAGTFWMAQYWVMRGRLDRARAILDAAIGCANDLKLFSEEADPRTGLLLGNFPQAFVHAAFLGAAVDLRAAESARASCVRLKGEAR